MNRRRGLGYLLGPLHPCATLLLAEGVHSKTVQQQLGHADISMNLNRYRHVTPDMQRVAADTFDETFSSAS